MANSFLKIGYYFTFFTLLTIFYNPVHAGKLERGFEELKVYNFHDAEKLFRKALKRDCVGGSYGLAYMYAMPNTPLLNKDSAYKFIRIADTLYPKLEEKDIEDLAEVNINRSTIDSVKQAVSHYYFVDLTDTTDVQLYNNFIAKHHWYNQLDRAISLRNQYAFQNALDTNTYTAYRHFMDCYPNAPQFQKAKEKYEIRFFETKTQDGTLDDYQVFVKDYPDSPFLPQAQRKVYQLSTRDGSLSSFINFILENQDNPYVDEAWENIFYRSVKTFATEELIDFRERFDNYPKKKKLNAYIDQSRKRLIPMIKNGKWGFIDTLGNWAIEPKFHKVDQFHEGKALAGNGDKLGYIDLLGEWYIEPRYEDGFAFQNHVATVEKNGKLGMINYYGEMMLLPSYSDLGEMLHGRIFFKSENDLYGYFNKNGEVAIEPKFSSAYDFESGLARVKVDSGWSVIDTAGQLLFKPVFDQVSLFKDSTVRAKLNNKFGLLKASGDTLLPFEYDFIGSFSNDRSIVAKGGKYYYINSRGQVAIKSEYEYSPIVINYGQFENGYAKYRHNMKFGVIDTTGKRVFPAIFEEIGTFTPPLVPVKKYGKWGFANMNVDLEIRYRFDYAWPFIDSLARIEVSDSVGVIDREGEYVLPANFEELTPVKHGYISKRKGNYGLLDKNADFLLPEIFHDVQAIDERYFIVRIESYLAIFDMQRNRFIYAQEGFSELMIDNSMPAGSDQEK
ncbi:WG repeat-containing protein [Salibacter sp.]|uniref:WG repeat-containing protein n=1 Tax=Salibacter sp. TaxID=2010995 RepID=UPI00287094BF|nr:WG repeat-containing protein [Salibacter sp.]MDR9487158.1 WG repeat-containing protein [Salibacter sp.]